MPARAETNRPAFPRWPKPDLFLARLTYGLKPVLFKTDKRPSGWDIQLENEYAKKEVGLRRGFSQADSFCAIAKHLFDGGQASLERCGFGGIADVDDELACFHIPVLGRFIPVGEGTRIELEGDVFGFTWSEANFFESL